MRKFLAVTMLALVCAAAGCNSCRQMTSGWFNHGDRCNPYPPPTDCPPGVPRATMMIPNSTTVLPGAIEVAPQ